MSDKTWEPGMFECSEQLLFSCVSSKVIVCHAIYHMSYLTYHMSNVKGLTLTHSLTLPLSLPLSLLHSHSHSLSLTLSLSHLHSLDMLNNFCFHVYAQKSLSHSLTLSLSHSLIFSFTRNIFCFDN